MARSRRLIAAAAVSVTIWAVPMVSHADQGTYVVKEGDSLFGIASRSGVSLGALLKVNDLVLTSVIHPGQRLEIPGSSSSSSTSSSGGSSYTVRSGDTLIGIARRHDVSLSSLLATNNMTTSSLIMPGMKLRLPTGATASATTPAGPSASASGASSYTVRSGDTLIGIARRHDVSLSSLLATNNMTTSSLIMPGMKLRLPTGATAPPPGAGTSSSTATGTAKVVSYALAQQGKPYRFFTAGPATFDCSGLTRAAYEQIGVKLVHHSASQATQGSPVDFLREPIRPGDLVFLSTRSSPYINHVGIAVNSTTWVHAVGTGSAVRVGSMPHKSAITRVRRYVSTG